MRTLIISKRVEDKLIDFVNKHPSTKKKFYKVTFLLKQNIFDPILRTHKLSGKLKSFYACSVDYDYRLVFAFDEKSVYILNIGTHDEVY